MDPLDYWKIRALTAERANELAQGEMLFLRQQLQAVKTSQRVDAIFARLKADGVIDLTEGEWVPDDVAETFRRRDQASTAAQPGDVK